jgi:hypothetical protein
MDTLIVISTIVGILSSIATSIGIWFIARQIADARRFTKTQFIYSLEQDFQKFGKTYTHLLPSGNWSSDGVGPQTEEDRYELSEYLGFFGRIKLLIDNKVIDLKTIDRLYAYRFFLIVNNTHIQRDILYKKGDYFLAVFSLHSQWYYYRKLSQQKIVNDVYNLFLYDQQQYQIYVNMYNSLK